LFCFGLLWFGLVWIGLAGWIGLVWFWFFVMNSISLGLVWFGCSLFMLTPSLAATLLVRTTPSPRLCRTRSTGTRLTSCLTATTTSSTSLLASGYWALYSY
jgi:hypothetical protein